MNKHTPGPWLFQISPDGQGRIVSQATSESICRWLGAGTASGIKNAHLIMAAPNLLDNLEALIWEFASECESTDPMHCQWCIARHTAKKARGEA